MSIRSILTAVCCLSIFVLCSIPDTWARDYNRRFVRNYPPGFHSMWHSATRFFETKKENVPAVELYRCDRFMTQVTCVSYPFFPVPYEWDYGTGRKFNLPNYNTNDWR